VLKKKGLQGDQVCVQHVCVCACVCMVVEVLKNKGLHGN